MYDGEKVRNEHLKLGIEKGVLNDEVVNDNNVRIVCCGTLIDKIEDDNYKNEWFYYNMSVFDLVQEELEKLYKTDVKSYTTEWFDNKGLKYGDESYNSDASQLYIIPMCIRSWSYSSDGISYIYRDTERIAKLAFEKPDEKIITKYIWSEDSDNIYRLFNRVIIKEHKWQLDLNTKLSNLLGEAVALIR